MALGRAVWSGKRRDGPARRAGAARPAHHSPTRGALAILALLVLASACSSSDKKPLTTLPPPRVATSVSYQLGGPLRGHDAPGAPLAPEAFATALSLRVAVLAWGIAPSMPAPGLPAPASPGSLAPLVPTARLLVVDATDRPLAATSRLLANASAGPADVDALVARSISGEVPARLVRDVRACLVPGASTVVELARDEAPEGAAPRRARVALVLAARDGGLDAAIEIDDAQAPGEIVATTVAGSAVTRWTVVVPSPFAGDATRFVVFSCEVGPAPAGAAPFAAAHEEAVARARRELVAQSTVVTNAIAPIVTGLRFDVGLALSEVVDEGRPRTLQTRRASFYRLGVAAGARTVEELAVGLDDASLRQLMNATVATLVSSVFATRGTSDVSAAFRTAPREEVGLALEKAVLAAAREALLDDDTREDLVSSLERRGGAAFGLIVSLAREFEGVTTLEELERAIEAQNLLLLEDPSPRIRVRAKRWLEQRMDLQGYSPLDSSSDRRAAVLRIRSKRS